MRNFFNMDNGLFRALGRLADLMILNIVFIICCIPIFTIGASLTAMYYVTLKMAENEEGYVIRSFWKSFKQNFKQATILWLIFLAFGIILVLDLVILRNSSGAIINGMRIVITATMVVYFIVLLYVFPTLSRFYNSIKTTVKNAFIMAVADLPRTFAIVVITVGAVLITFINAYTIWYGILVWLLAGFSLVAFANSFFFKKIFAKYIPADTEDENPDHWDMDEIEGSASLDAVDEKAEEETAEEPKI